MRVLVVEDDRDLNRQLVSALSDAGYAVDAAFGDWGDIDGVIVDVRANHGGWDASSAFRDFVVASSRRAPDVLSSRPR